jgi:predicted MFS family arabinose efflux permease
MLWLLAGIQFSHIVDFMIMMPLGPQIMREFSVGPTAFSTLVSAYSVSAAFSGLVAAGFVDRIEHKRLLLILFGLFALATLACALAPSYAMLITARSLAGVFGGVLSGLVHAISGDLVPEHHRGRASGIIMTGFSISTVAGVPISLALAAEHGWRAPFVALTVLSLVLWTVAQRFLPTTTDPAAGPLQRDRGLMPLVRHPQAWRCLLFGFLMPFAGFMLIPFFAIHLTGTVGLAESDLPWIYLCGGFATLFTARIIGWLSDRYGKPLMFRVMALLAMVPMVWLPLLGPTGLGLALVCTTSFFILVSGRAVPAMALLTSAMPADLRGRFMSVNNSGMQMGMGLGSALAGLVVSINAQGQLEGFWVSSLMAVSVSLLSIWWVGRLPRPG